MKYFLTIFTLFFCILRVLLKLYTQISSHFHSYLKFPQIDSLFPPTILSKAELMDFVYFLISWMSSPSDTMITVQELWKSLIYLLQKQPKRKKEYPNIPCQRLAKVEVL